MPFGNLASLWARGQVEQPRSGLTLADLYREPVDPTYPDAPTWARSRRDLDPEMQRQLRTDMLMGTIGSGLAGAQSGRTGSAMLAAVMQARQQEQQAIEIQRQRQEEEYIRERQAAEDRAKLENVRQERAERQRVAQSNLGAYQAIVQMAGDSAPELVARAEAAARAGDQGELQRILADAPKIAGFNKAMRGANVDPYDPFAVRKVDDQADIAKARQMAEGQAQVYAAHREPQRQFVQDQATGAWSVLDERTLRAQPVMGPGGDPFGTSKVDPLWKMAVSEAEDRGQRLTTEAARSLDPDVKEAAKVFDTRGYALRLYEQLQARPAPGMAGVRGGSSSVPSGGPMPLGTTGQPPAEVVQLLQQIQSIDPGAAAKVTERIRSMPSPDWALIAAELRAAVSRTGMR